MMLDENGGGMAGNDLRTLIESRIPEHRAHLETSYFNLGNVAAYCEANYLKSLVSPLLHRVSGFMSQESYMVIPLFFYSSFLTRTEAADG